MWVRMTTTFMLSGSLSVSCSATDGSQRGGTSGGAYDAGAPADAMTAVEDGGDAGASDVFPDAADASTAQCSGAVAMVNGVCPVTPELPRWRTAEGCFATVGEACVCLACDAPEACEAIITLGGQRDVRCEAAPSE